jgi:endonuclease III
MTASNRASKIDALYKSLKKHFKPAPEGPERSVLEHLLYACCLEDARSDQADEAFAKLQQTYFDWNEVRVTTVSELGQCLQSLPCSSSAAQRIKQCLQSLFESRYQYEIDDLKKANLGKAVAELQAWRGISPFVVSYVSQQALGGHSIPISNVVVEALLQCEIINAAEAEKKSVPGLERAIPKNRGIEFGSLLQQFALEMQSHPKSQPVQAVLKELGVAYKAKPKAEPKAAEPPKASPTKKLDVKKPLAEPPKVEKAPPKSTDKKELATKPPAKSAAKKMASPPPTKEPSSVKTPSPPKKSEPRAQPTGKQVPKKTDKKENKKTKPVAKSKPTDNKGKKPANAKSKKPSGTSKSTTGASSIASNLTKKKPK